MKTWITPILFAVILAGCATTDKAPESSAGEEISTVDTTPAAAEEASQWPTDAMILHLASVMPRKDDPSRQFIAHSYCNELNPDLTQCVLFDSHSSEARMIGMEYIASAQLYARMPILERRFWHSRRDAVLSGLLVAPGMDPAKESELMRKQLGTYSKTIYFPLTQSSDLNMASVPLGDPQFAGSFSEPTQADAALVQSLENQCGFSAAEKSQERQQLFQSAGIAAP